MMETTAISPQFVQSISSGLRYWQQRTSEKGEQHWARIDRDRVLLYRVVQYGIELPQTWQETAVLMLHAFDLVARQGYWPEWIPFLQQAIARCDHSNLSLKIRLLSQLGQLLRAEHLPEALEAHLQAQTLVQQVDDERITAELNLNLCNDYLKQRNYNKAEQHGMNALSQFSQLPDAEERTASTLHALGVLAMQQGQFPQAEQRFTQALQQWERINHILYHTRSLLTLAYSLQEQKRYIEAEQHLLKAQALLAPTIYELDKILVQLNLGMLYYRQEQWQKAEAALRSGDTLYLRRSPHTYYQTIMANNLGNVLLQQQQWSQAEVHLRRAYRLAQSTHDDVQLANIGGSLAETLIKQNNYEEAETLLTQAIELLTQHPTDAWAQKLLHEFRNLQKESQTLHESISQAHKKPEIA